MLERVSCRSLLHLRVRGVGLPRDALPEHGVEGAQKFAHASYQGYLLGLAGCTQTFVVVSDYRITFGSRKSPNIQDRSNLFTSTPDSSPSAHRAAIAVERSDPDKGGELLAVDDPEFGQVRQECQRKDSTNSRDASE